MRQEYLRDTTVSFHAHGSERVITVRSVVAIKRQQREKALMRFVRRLGFADARDLVIVRTEYRACG